MIDTVIDFCEGQEQIFFTSGLFSSLCVTLILFFSYFPATFQKFQGVNRISQTVKKLRVRHSERCAPVLEPVSLFLLLQLSPSAGSCLSFSFSPPYALSSFHPTLSKRPGVSTGQLKPAYTPRPQIHVAQAHTRFRSPHKCTQKSAVLNTQPLETFQRD